MIILHFNFFEPIFTVIVVLPDLIGVTVPYWSTVATDVLDDVKKGKLMENFVDAGNDPMTIQNCEKILDLNGKKIFGGCVD